MRRCTWKLDDNPDTDVWETGCDGKFEFTAGTPAENDFVFCPYCGGLLFETDEEVAA